jgi:hypothetical protein
MNGYRTQEVNTRVRDGPKTVSVRASRVRLSRGRSKATNISCSGESEEGHSWTAIAIAAIRFLLISPSHDFEHDQD